MVKTHKRLKKRFLIGRNRTKRANFRGSPLSQATHNIKTEKQTINWTYPVSVRCSEAGGWINWHKISWIIFFFWFYVVRSLKKRTSRKFAHFVLFRPIKKRSFYLLCVLDLFFSLNVGCQHCFRFFLSRSFPHNWRSPYWRFPSDHLAVWKFPSQLTFTLLTFTSWLLGCLDVALM